MVKVSIIVPVYNGEGYIKKCLDSLVNQTLKDIEIIVINDGSKDKTLDILKEYQKKYKNIKIITRENKGIAESRNEGITKAEGRYIAFLDSDDFVDLTMYEKLYQKITSCDFDVVTTYFNFQYEDKVEKGVIDLKKDILDIKDLKKYFLNMYPVVWNKLYKKELFDDLKFRDVYAEDVDILYRILPKIKKMGVVKDYLYYYYQRENSESKVYTKKLFDYVYNFNDLYKYYQTKWYMEEFKKEFEYVYVRYLYATFLKRSVTLDFKMQEKAFKLAVKNVQEKFPKYRLNKYFYKSLKGIYLVTFNKFYYKIMQRRG